MTFGRRFSWVNNKYDNYDGIIQEPPHKQKEYIELCSIPCKDN